MTRRIWIQVAAFIVIALASMLIMAINYMRLPSLLFGVGQYTVTVELPEAAGLYERANVTYEGTDVGYVKDVHLTDSGVDAVVALQSRYTIPSDLEAQVHSVSAVGEQYIALLPRNGNSPPLKDGSVIARATTSVPPDINELLNATNRGLEVIPQGNLQTTVDEAYTALGGLGPDLSRLVKGATTLAIDAQKNLDDLKTLNEQTKPILDTQIDTSDSVQAWAAHLAEVTTQLKTNDSAVAGVLNAGPAAVEVRRLFDRLQPTLPIVLTNLVSVGEVAVAYRPSIEQLLVLLPTGTEAIQAIVLPNKGTKQRYNGAFLSFNLNLNLPPACTTGFIPIQQQRAGAFQDYPDRPVEAGGVYCRVPQDSAFNVRGLRNDPCITRPGKRAPTWQLCESDQNYVPLNEGYNWKGDPNATLSGQPLPDVPPNPDQPPGPPPGQGNPPANAMPPPIAAAEYDPATGTYVGPDGREYTQANLSASAAKEPQTWQTMLMPPPGT